MWGILGTHIESVISYITGRKLQRVSAALDCYGMELDVNANILAEYENNLHGSFSCSQVYSGEKEGIAVSIWGTEGMIEWSVADFNRLRVTRNGQTEDIYWKADENAEGGAAHMGFEEGVVHAFVNIYLGFTDKILEQRGGECDRNTKAPADFPDVEAGVRGVRFVHAAVKSSKNHCGWTRLDGE